MENIGYQMLLTCRVIECKLYKLTSLCVNMEYVQIVKILVLIQVGYSVRLPGYVASCIF